MFACKSYRKNIAYAEILETSLSEMTNLFSFSLYCKEASYAARPGVIIIWKNNKNSDNIKLCEIPKLGFRNYAKFRFIFCNSN